jgi:trk system potassium uptake protein TrkA
MNIVVIGGGKVGYYLAKTLLSYHHRVSVIEMKRETCQKVADELKSKGIALTFKSFAGAHEWRVWRNSLVDFAPMLFR